MFNSIPKTLKKLIWVGSFDEFLFVQAVITSMFEAIEDIINTYIMSLFASIWLPIFVCFFFTVTSFVLTKEKSAFLENQICRKSSNARGPS